MEVQYLSDSRGHKTAVVIPIKDWELLKKKYIEFEEAGAQNDTSVVPDWQIELGREELEKLKNGNSELIEWDKIKKQLGL